MKLHFIMTLGWNNGEQSQPLTSTVTGSFTADKNFLEGDALDLAWGKSIEGINKKLGTKLEIKDTVIVFYRLAGEVTT